MFNKKAEVVSLVIILIIVIFAFFGWLFNINRYECNNNSECREEHYCGVDHNCHKIPVIEKSPVIVNRDYSKPSLIIGGAIVLASIFFNFDKIKPRRRPETPQTYY